LNFRYVASGSFDTTLKIWGAKLQSRGNNNKDSIEEEAEAEPEKSAKDSKRAKKTSSSSTALTRTPVMTLAGHKEGISGVAFTEQGRGDATKLVLFKMI
jgi:hypothetical protein